MSVEWAAHAASVTIVARRKTGVMRMLDTWREMLQAGYQITRVEADQSFWGAHWRVESPNGWIEDRYDAGWISTYDGKDEEWVARLKEAVNTQWATRVTELRDDPRWFLFSP